MEADESLLAKHALSLRGFEDWGDHVSYIGRFLHPGREYLTQQGGATAYSEQMLPDRFGGVGRPAVRVVLHLSARLSSLGSVALMENDTTSTVSGDHQRRRALVTGVTGQDGSYLAELLLAKGYEVHGVVRRSSLFNTDRIDHLHVGDDPNQSFHLHYGDLSDAGALRNLLDETQPHEVYNLGAQSHVRVSFDQPEYTVDVTGVGTLRLLEAIRHYQKQSGAEVRFYQAGSSEMFGSANPPQFETTRFEPRSPYACAKVYSHYQVVNHRESYGLFACNGILFNHESPRRGETFVTRKITRAATRIKLGLQDKLFLGNIDAKRDWGFAGDYVDAMWRMLQQDAPDDYVVATGESISVKDFLVLAFEHLELNWEQYVEFDERYLRPAEVDHLHGDATKAREVLGWTPKIDIRELAGMMVESDLRLAEREHVLRNAGHEEVERGGYR